MCETTKAIQHHPESQRNLLKIRVICERWERKIQDLLDELAKHEEPNAVAE